MTSHNGSENQTQLVYEGVRILDFTQLEQGPSGTQVLADFGAEVIKVERPDIGEIGRRNGTRVNGWSPHWAANNRNKRSLSLDVKDPQARPILDELVRRSDIVVSNFRPGVMERLGLGHEDLVQLNPRIISAYASGYGRTGPYRHRRGQDLAAQAMGGIIALTGSPEQPSAIGTYAVDYLAAMHLAQGMMLALAARDRTGQGQVVDVSLLNSSIAMHLQEGSEFLNRREAFPRSPGGIAHSGSTGLYGIYTGIDGKSFVLVADVFVDEPWSRICQALDADEAETANPLMASTESMKADPARSHAVVQALASRFTRDECVSRLEKQDLLSAPVNDYDELFDDPQVLHNNMILELEHPVAGAMRLVGMPVKLSGTPGTVRLLPPMVGEHNQSILAELGLDSAQIDALRHSGVVGAESTRQTPAW
ncbi:CaiB/BaiF CoA transferase family protein [Mycolicibacterium tokaiense]|uniref:L-carnitine dehydratase/bile acid-inducible protein F n=1 Tax=Mycolicibacterium tokaiense TaxID=39695 RepID=A0A378TGY2_9MYCO|nr:CoA transferase [Mycolicibacterium tokaiense]BBY85693.1 CoA transferase [Mycolicibacterium tokaiense]STZ59794.1 L-carnitine dehydratase/bile acid-inducible protein F [Mycolicibacterium tokaiense]